MSKVIYPDSKIGKKFGFTSDKFSGYLSENGNKIWISFIWSLQEGKGNLRKLFDEIEGHGYDIIVPTPSSRMRKICKRRGMVETAIECSYPDGDFDYVNCMMKA